MRTLYAQAAGNASEIAYKVDGVGDDVAWGDMLDTDDVEANNFAVALNPATFTRGQLQTLNGGSFTCDLAVVGNREFTCNVLAGLTPCLTITGAAYSLNLIGDSWGGSAENAFAVNINSAATVRQIGNTTGGSAAGAFGTRIAVAGATFAHDGIATGGSHANASGIYVAGSTGTINLLHVANGSNKYAGGVQQASVGAAVTIRGVVDLMGGNVIRYSSSATAANPVRLARSAMLRVYGPDGTTPIYFRPYSGRGLMVGGAL